jgi:hypothetical protein
MFGSPSTKEDEVMIDESTKRNPDRYLVDKARGIKLVFCPVTGFIGVWFDQDEKWTIHGPHPSFAAAVDWLRWSCPVLDLDDDDVERWRKRIEQPADRGLH